jgi:hypothetical protein
MLERGVTSRPEIALDGTGSLGVPAQPVRRLAIARSDHARDLDAFRQALTASGARRRSPRAPSIHPA